MRAKLRSLGENWVKRHSLQHSLRQDTLFEVLHAKNGFGVIWGQNTGIRGSFGGKIGEFGEIGSNDPHYDLGFQTSLRSTSWLMWVKCDDEKLGIWSRSLLTLIDR